MSYDTSEIPRESKEYITLGFKVDGSTPTAGVEAVLLARSVRPTEPDWAAAEYVDGDWRILVGPNLPLGEYDIWARHTANPEKTVRCARRAIRII